MRKFRICLLVLALGGCSFTTIADRYGNEYGDWYNPGGNFAWQLQLCERQMDARNIVPMSRKAAMRCCMRDHGVPVDNAENCRA